MKRSLTTIAIMFAMFFAASKSYFAPTNAENSTTSTHATTSASGPPIPSVTPTSSSDKSTSHGGWQGRVTYVVDGDTLRIKPTDDPSTSEPKKIRIAGIDAPESCQTYGAQSTAALKQLVSTKTVTVLSTRIDEYGRDVAKITVNDQDVGAWMVRNGHAWSYHYKHSNGPYRVEEDAALGSRLGLFADLTAVEPQVFRREHGTCHVPKNITALPHKPSK